MRSTEPTDLSPQPTRLLAGFAAGLCFEDLPASLVARIKLHTLDGIGVALRGMTLPWTRCVRDFVLAEGSVPTAALWGSGRRVSVSNAALVNGTAGHAFEMDDIHKESILHPNSLAVPVALAIAQSRPGTGGRDLLSAIVAGYEVGTRVGNAATTALFLNGFHPQGTTGVFAAVATAAHLLGLDADATQHAFGIAGSLGAGLMAAQEGAMVKRLHSGRAAQSGVVAASLAARGFTGILNVLEAEYGGFLSALGHGGYRLDRLTDGPGTDWEAGKVGFKMYPNVTSIHTALDALRQLLDETRLSAKDIASIEVGCGHMTYVHTAWPYRPQGVTAAQMNLFYGLAVMALRGKVDASDYAEARIADADVLAFIPRIQVHEDPELEAMGPAYRHACRLTVHTSRGDAFRCEMLSRRGSPENDVSEDEITQKFHANVDGLMDKDAARNMVELVSRLDTLTDLAPLYALLETPAGVA
jgi:2-methylcitrate dehydratase PrpD